MTIIVHNSKSGSSERYARRLSEMTGMPCYSVRDEYPKDERIVFFGWLKRYTVMGLSKVDIGMVDSLCVVGVDNVDFFPRNEVRSSNKFDGEIHYLRGWIRPERLGFLDRLILRIVSKKLLKEMGDHADMTLIDAMTKGGDFYDDAYLEPIVESLNV